MTQEEKDLYEDMMDEIDQAETVQEVFDIVSDYYDLENCELGTLSKPMFVKGLQKAIAMLKPEFR